MSAIARKLFVAAAVLSLSAGVTACSSSGESDGRNAAVVAGTACKKSGEYTKKSGQKVVCGKSAGARVWYGVASVKKTKCRSLGTVRISDGVVFVCGANKSAKVWMSTKALSAANPQVVSGQLVSTSPSAQAGSAEPPSEVMNTIAPPVPGPAPSTTVETATLNPTTTVPGVAGPTVGRGDRVPGPYATDLSVRQVATSNNANCAIDTVGAVWCWGYNESGQLGNGTLVTSSVPVRNRIFDGSAHKAVKVVSGFTGDFCALDYAGAVWCWGNGSSGSLGNGMRVSSATPILVDQFDGVTNKAIDLFGDWGTYCVLDPTKRVWCWGASWGVAKWGDLSIKANALSPRKIAGLENTSVSSVGVGIQSICAVDLFGGVWCWGSNTGGSLGIGDSMLITDRQPTKVMGSIREDFIAREVVASRFNFCALQVNNRVRCWGLDPTLRSITSPGDGGTPLLITALTGDIAVKNLYGAQERMCLVSTLGKLLCWGGDRVADPAVFMGYDGVAKQARSVGKVAGASTILNVTGRLEIVTSSIVELEGQGYSGSVD